MTLPVGIRSLAVSFPSTIRTNDYYRENYPELIAQVEEKIVSKMISQTEGTSSNEFDMEMAQYVQDPFGGSVERRVVGLGETSLTLSYRAACDALEAAKLSVEEVDLMLVATIFPEQLVPGNAAALAGEIGLHGAAWNLDSTCASAIVALQTACALVRAGEYRNVLVVICNNYSLFADPNETHSLSASDGAAAFVVSSLKPNQGVLGTKIINTAETCGVYVQEWKTDEQGNPQVFMRPAKGAAKMFSDMSVKCVRECCKGALEVAGLTLDQINFFAFYTPTAWARNVCVRALGIDPERTLNLYDRYANAGGMLPLAYLYHGAQAGKFKENDLVLAYGLGGVSNAGAIVMRWGDVALGPAPAPPVSLNQQEDRILTFR